jgi:bacillithiol biosynthesis cysteine-adding enzyme BshC
VSVDPFCIPYSQTGYFSTLVNDYLAGDHKLQEFFAFTPDMKGLDAAIAARPAFPVDRKVLTDTLRRQYEGLNCSEAVTRNLTLLEQENTFTICTAHQPNLMTGYLYFVYKILHAVKLAELLQERHPDKNFVPVYYMGSEDNDLDELGQFRFAGQQFVWTADVQKGAVGRMRTESMKSLLDSLFRLLGPPGPNAETLAALLTQAYMQHDTVSEATQYLVNELFGRYGLVVLNPDEAAFKKEILPVLKEELLRQSSYEIVLGQTQRMETHYKVQAQPRPLNLFYLHDQLRERIEKHADRWIVVNTDISWTEEALLAELEAHPERFSPNVILRGLLQEKILPDIAFIGGGSEVAYWLQLMPLFRHHNVFYPTVLLRQSALWIPAQAATLRKKLGIAPAALFLSEETLYREYLERHGEGKWKTNGAEEALTDILGRLKKQAIALDPTLEASAEAALAKIRHQLEALEQKMYRAQKRKMQHHLEQIKKLRDMLFPGGSLQERHDNFMPCFLEHGFSFFDELKTHFRPEEPMFLILEETN